MISLVLVIVCVALRLLPHPPNFAPVGATAVFSGRTLPRWSAIAVALGAMALGDVGLSALHGYPLVTAVTPFVYAGFLGQVLLGRALRAARGGALVAAGLGAMVFFALSNFGVWLTGYYGLTTAGLVACYVAALPFLAGTVAGDLLWTVTLGLVHRALIRRFAAETAPAGLPIL